MTKDEAVKELEEHLRDADKAISEDEEYIRGWKSALLVALEISTKVDGKSETHDKMPVTYLYTDLQDKLVQMMVEYLCEDHTETELMELVQKAIKHSDGDKD